MAPAFPRFSLGRVVATPGALQTLINADQSAYEFLGRHARGDWGELSDDDREANNHALKDGDRLLSAYKTTTGNKVWIITEWDRSVTTVLLPEEY